MISKISKEDFVKGVLQSEKPVVVDFYADWCAPCKMLSPVLKELSDTYTEFDFYKTNIDENPQLAASFGIESIPNILIFKKGVVCDSSIGFISAEKLRNFLDNNR